MTGLRTSYSTSIRSKACSAIIFDVAETPATACPLNNTLSLAIQKLLKNIGFCIAPSPKSTANPLRTGKSSDVTTATTPGSSNALEVSIFIIFA